MSYCTTDDIAGMNPTRTYGATSTPTVTQIGEYIDLIAGEMNTVLAGRGLAVPVTTPAQLVTFLKQLNMLGAGAMTEQAMFPETRGQMSAPASQVLWKQYRDGLEFLRNGQLMGTSGVAYPFSFRTEEGGDTEPSEEHGWQKPKFGMNKEF